MRRRVTLQSAAGRKRKTKVRYLYVSLYECVWVCVQLSWAEGTTQSKKGEAVCCVSFFFVLFSFWSVVLSN